MPPAMLPRFNEALPLSADKTSVMASGPLMLSGDEDEAYLWLRLVQGSGARKVDGANQREVELKGQNGKPAKSWECEVTAGEEKKFRVGTATAEAWLLLRDGGAVPFESQTYWKTRVTLEVPQT
jgi:hypothetical protein